MTFRFNPLIPELDASDFSRSLEFYTGVLGFKIEYQREERGFALLSYQGSQIMIEQYNGNWSTGSLDYPYGRGINLSICTDEIDHIVERLEKAQITSNQTRKELDHLHNYECQ